MPPGLQGWGAFWGAQQRFFRGLCIASKVPAVLQQSAVALAEGKCVVIGLQSTGEANTMAKVEAMGEEMDDFVSAPRAGLEKMLLRMLPLPEDALIPVQEADSEDSADDDAEEADAKPA